MNAAISMRSKRGLTGTVGADAGDLKLRAYFSFVPAISASDLSLSVEKPGSFLVDFDVPQKDFKFQFLNTARVLEKQLNMTYTYWRGENRTILDGTLLLDHNNKISASYAIDSRNCKLKYSHVHRGVYTFEPCYDFGKNSWELVASTTFLDGDVIKASYVTSSKALELQWFWKSSFNKDGRCKEQCYTHSRAVQTGCAQNKTDFTVSASFNLAEGLHTPTLTAESSWNFEM